MKINRRTNWRTWRKDRLDKSLLPLKLTMHNLRCSQMKTASNPTYKFLNRYLTSLSNKSRSTFSVTYSPQLYLTFWLSYRSHTAFSLSKLYSLYRALGTNYASLSYQYHLHPKRAKSTHQTSYFRLIRRL